MFRVSGREYGADNVDENNVLEIVSMVNSEGETSWMSEKAETTNVGEFVVENIGERSNKMRKAVNTVTDCSIRKNLKKMPINILTDF